MDLSNRPLSESMSHSTYSYSHEDERASKRRRNDVDVAVAQIPYLHDNQLQKINNDEPPFDLNPWENNALYALEVVGQCATHLTGEQPNSTFQYSNKRTLVDDAEYDIVNAATADPGDPVPQHTIDLPDYQLYSEMPELFPSVPARADRIVDVIIPNPCAGDIGKPRHQWLGKPKGLPKDGMVVNGYVKFRIRSLAQSTSDGGRFHMSNSTQLKSSQTQFPRSLDRIPNLPPGFERGVRMDSIDEKTFRFFLVGFCGGRTLLPKNNFWFLDIAPMVSKSECLKHTLLSLTLGYLLDFIPDKSIQSRANLHFARGAKLLTDLLNEKQVREPGKEEALIASLVMIIAEDVIKWELRKPLGEEPRWYAAAKAAKVILDNSDPGYRYCKPENVQTTQARLSCSTWVAYVKILADIVTPYEVDDTGNMYSWLLEGTRSNARKIHGGAGVSPKLLHTFAQITHLSARLSQSSDDTVIILAAHRIEERLKTLHQWSDLSPGYVELATLVSDCKQLLNVNTGKVDDAGKVTDLIGHAWICAAQIYLQCRLHRRPRGHPLVHGALRNLITCIELMPSSGELFTAQSPFFAIFMMALVSVGDDRGAAKRWFETVCSAAGDRSSVPPLWDSLKRTWAWMDGEVESDTPFVEDDVVLSEEDEEELGSRTAWWEQMVNWVVKHEGILSLI